jgi:hypothetical protein
MDRNRSDRPTGSQRRSGAGLQPRMVVVAGAEQRALQQPLNRWRGGCCPLFVQVSLIRGKAGWELASASRGVLCIRLELHVVWIHPVPVAEEQHGRCNRPNQRRPCHARPCNRVCPLSRTASCPAHQSVEFVGLLRSGVLGAHVLPFLSSSEWLAQRSRSSVQPQPNLSQPKWPPSRGKPYFRQVSRQSRELAVATDCRHVQNKRGSLVCMHDM